MQSQTEAIRCDVPTPYMFLFATVLVTISATAMLCCAIVTDNWEKIYWDRETLDRMASNQSNSHLQWYSDDKFARMDVIPTGKSTLHSSKTISLASSNQFLTEYIQIDLVCDETIRYFSFQ